MRTVKACLSLFRIRVAESFQYRMSVFSGTVTSLMWGLVEAVIYTVFYRYASKAGFAGGLTLEQAINHVWVRELLLCMAGMGLDEDIRKKITSGDVGVEMCRPLDLYWHWFARTSAGKVVYLVMRGAVCFGLAFLIPGGYGAKLPATPAALALFLLSTMCAFLLCASFTTFLSALRTNVSWGDGPVGILVLLSSALSGSMVPLQLWPDLLQPFLLLQPFAGLVDIPARLYIGSMSASDAWQGMGVQLCWSVIFIVLGKFILTRKLRTIVAQGG